eukprot:tig00000241_g20996.t1
MNEIASLRNRLAAEEAERERMRRLAEVDAHRATQELLLSYQAAHREALVQAETLRAENDRLKSTLAYERMRRCGPALSGIVVGASMVPPPARRASEARQVELDAPLAVRNAELSRRLADAERRLEQARDGEARAAAEGIAVEACLSAEIDELLESQRRAEAACAKSAEAAQLVNFCSGPSWRVSPPERPSVSR